MKSMGVTECSLLAVFRKVFKVLLVDDEETVRALARDIFDGIPIFDLDTTATAKETDRRFTEGTYHFCFCDLGINDCQGDQYYLVKKHGSRLPVIILSGRASMEESAHCMSMGATWVYDKPVPLDRDFIMSVMNRFLLRSLFLHGTRLFQHVRYEEVINALIANKPASVEEWARIVNVNERYLRKICENCPLPLRHMISTVNLIDCLLSCCTTGKTCMPPRESHDHQHPCRKASDFYYLNKNPVDKFLRIETNKWNAVPHNVKVGSDRAGFGPER